MSVISNISALQKSQDKKAFSKISFEVGEKFNARIVSTDTQKGEVNLKLLDGWQFSAKLDKPLEPGTDGSVLKFEVEGFEEGKLKIKLTYEDTEGKAKDSDILKDFTKGKILDTNKGDALIFEKMVKHNMPLTKDNIIDIKNLVDFKEKIFLSEDQEQIFITKYLNSRGIDPSSEKANEISKILKDFFQTLKTLNIDEILLFKENNMELTKGNLDSFIKLFKGESAIYNNLKEINSYLLNSDNATKTDIQKSLVMPLINDNVIDFKEIDINSKEFNYKNLQAGEKSKSIDNPIDNKNLKELVGLINKELRDLDISHRVLNSTTKNLQDGDANLNNNTIKTLVDKIFKEQQIPLSPDNHIKIIDNLEKKLNPPKGDNNINTFDIVKESEKLSLNKSENNKTEEIEQGIKNGINTKAHGYGKNNSLNDIVNMIKKELNISDIDKGIINDNEISINNEKNTEKLTTDTIIKEQIKVKTEDIKSMIKDIIENKLNLKTESFDKVMSVFDQKLNDVKVFNSISEQYYYLDLPINVKEKEYQLKMVIKDDRKKGKKIDSKNVKIAASVKTINIGTVDAYIKVNNNSMNIDINCDKFWVEVLSFGKEKLMKDLSNLNYRVSIEVNKRASEFTLTNCREFFDDRNFSAINVKV